MRILTLQNAVLVSLAAGVVALSACSSSDADRPQAGAGAPGSAGAPGTAGASPAAGAPGAAGAAGPSVCDGAGSRMLDATMPADAFIDDSETANAAGAEKPAGGWYGFNDIAPSGSNPIQPKRAMGGAAGTMFSVQYAGMGAKIPTMMGYGVGLEINLGVDQMAMPPIYCIDASAFKGVSFWAKANGMNKTVTVGFVVPSQNRVKFGGDCPDAAADAKCNNYPQKSIALTAEWAQYTVDFAGLKGTTGATVVGGKVQQVLWLAPTADWDFSLDEIAFYATTPPAGPVAVPPATM